MATTQGYVGTIEVETRGVARIWFGLTDAKNDDDWVPIAGQRAWFTMNLESAESRRRHMAELSAGAGRDARRPAIAAWPTEGTATFSISVSRRLLRGDPGSHPPRAREEFSGLGLRYARTGRWQTRAWLRARRARTGTGESRTSWASRTGKSSDTPISEFLRVSGDPRKSSHRRSDSWRRVSKPNGVRGGSSKLD